MTSELNVYEIAEDLSESELDTLDHSRQRSNLPFNTIENHLYENSLEEATIRIKFSDLYPEKIFDFIKSAPSKRDPQYSIKINEEPTYAQNFQLPSIYSEITSEELIMNEEIEFLTIKTNESPSQSLSPSLNYTISEPESASVFETFNWCNELLKSLPECEGEPSELNEKSFGSYDPRFNIERNDLRENPIEDKKVPMEIELVLTENQEKIQVEKIQTGEKFIIDKNESYCSCGTCQLL